jgi:hypothetical protein
MDIFKLGHVEFGQIEVDLSRKTKSQSSAQTSALYQMQKELEKQRLLIEVLIRALVDKGLYTRDQLNALANLVDMEDGIRDGRIAPERGVRHCGNCGRVKMNVSGSCLYCGHEEVMDLV